MDSKVVDFSKAKRKILIERGIEKGTVIRFPLVLPKTIEELNASNDEDTDPRKP